MKSFLLEALFGSIKIKWSVPRCAYNMAKLEIFVLIPLPCTGTLGAKVGTPIHDYSAEIAKHTHR